MKRTGPRFLVFVVMLGLVSGAAFWAFREVGRWLVDTDPLQHARAIVVLSGRTPFRAMEAAEIYRQGWAPEVWLFQDEPNLADKTFAKLGIRHPAESEYDQRVLERLGVPTLAIRLLEPPATNTVSEAMVIAKELSRQQENKIILVTSPLHTRRSKAIWHMVVGGHPQAIVRSTPYEPCDPDHWWRATQDVESVVHELLGLTNTYLGFVTKPRKR